MMAQTKSNTTDRWRLGFLLLVLALLALSGCVSRGATASGGRCGCEGWTPRSVRGFATPDPETWNEVMPAVWEYFMYRKRAVLAGDVGVLWQRYPHLAEGMDGTHGINAEAALVDGFRGPRPLDGNVFLFEERVRRDGKTVQVYVCGVEMYLLPGEDGRLWRSGGELMITLSLRKEGGRWQVYRTDEVTEAELPWERP